MKYSKTTLGFVTQRFNDTGQCINQEFIAGDQVDYEDMAGNSIEGPPNGVLNEQYHPFDMVQPTKKSVTPRVSQLGTGWFVE